MFEIKKKKKKKKKKLAQSLQEGVNKPVKQLRVVSPQPIRRCLETAI